MIRHNYGSVFMNAIANVLLSGDNAFINPKTKAASNLIFYFFKQKLVIVALNKSSEGILKST